MSSQTITITVGKYGKYQTVQEAVDAVPPNNTTRTVIRVFQGKYQQPVYVPKTKNYITLLGDGPVKPLLTFNNTASNIKSRRDSPLIGTKTFGCGTVIVEGDDFTAENITFQNSAPPPQGNEQQAVAVRVTADRCAFYNCSFLGWQDTLYLHSGKQYLRDCYIEGSVDFICGDSTALLEHCHIHCKSDGFITAQQRSKTSPTNTGYVFLSCWITGNGGKSYTYLGRPWDDFATVVFAYTEMDTCVRPEGWNNWEKPERESTAFFREYMCRGPGSSFFNPRVKWAQKVMTDNEVGQFLADGSPWLAIRAAVKMPHLA